MPFTGDGQRTDSSSVGRPVKRVEDAALLRGRGQFVADLTAPGMLDAVFRRSNAAHARILAVGTDRARRMPGVELVVTAAELGLEPLTPPIENSEAYSPARPFLAGELVRFVGEPIAVVVARNAYEAEDAAASIDVELEPLQPLVDPHDALGAPSLHANGTNVLYDSRFEAGEVDAAFARAAVVVERSFRNPRYSATPIENRGTIAAPEGDGVVIWSSTQAPHRLASAAAEVLGLDLDVVRVVCPDIGGGFGQKAHVYPEEIVLAWLALRLRRPVRWIEDRAENLLASSHARDQHLRVRVAADAEGRLLAMDADVICDCGAYGVFPHGHILEALGTPAMLPGPYRLENYRYRARAVATNKAPAGAYRGVGLPVAAFVHERLMDLLAGQLDIDRAEIRRRNLLRVSDLPYVTPTHQRYDSGDYPKALELALELVGYDGFADEREAARRDGRLLGFGVACYVEYTGINSRVFSSRGMVGIAGWDAAHVAFSPDGHVTAWTTLPAIGQGTATTFGQVIADELGVPRETVTVERSDTSVGGLTGTGTFASRSAVAGTGALVDAAAELRRRIFDDAAELLEASPDDLELRDGSVRVAGSPARALPLAELFAAGDGVATDRYRVSASYDPEAVAYPYATHACVIEVDPETGALAVQRYVIVEDCGNVINPLIVEGQVHGATTQGIGGALLEELIYNEDGQLLTGSLMDYLVPTAAEVPSYTVDHLAIPAPESPRGSKGVGEGGTLAPPGALANAVSDALGREFNTLPLRPEAISSAAARRKVSIGLPLDANRSM